MFALKEINSLLSNAASLAEVARDFMAPAVRNKHYGLVDEVEDVSPAYEPEHMPPQPNEHSGWRLRPCWYVCARKDAQLCVLVGPLQRKTDGNPYLKPTRSAAARHDPKAEWYEYITVQLPDGSLTGKLNNEAGVRYG